MTSQWPQVTRKARWHQITLEADVTLCRHSTLSLQQPDGGFSLLTNAPVHINIYQLSQKSLLVVGVFKSGSKEVHKFMRASFQAQCVLSAVGRIHRAKRRQGQCLRAAVLISCGLGALGTSKLRTPKALICVDLICQYLLY